MQLHPMEAGTHTWVGKTPSMTATPTWPLQVSISPPRVRATNSQHCPMCAHSVNIPRRGGSRMNNYGVSVKTVGILVWARCAAARD